jgi:hypothetical protein
LRLFKEKTAGSAVVSGIYLFDKSSRKAEMGHCSVVDFLNLRFDDLLVTFYLVNAESKLAGIDINVFFSFKLLRAPGGQACSVSKGFR